MSDALCNALRECYIQIGEIRLILAVGQSNEKISLRYLRSEDLDGSWQIDIDFPMLVDYNFECAACSQDKRAPNFAGLSINRTLSGSDAAYSKSLATSTKPHRFRSGFCDA